VNRSTLRIAAAALIASAVVLTACSGSSGSSGTGASEGADATTVLEGLADDVIVPGYEELSGRTATLSSAIDGLCTTPSDGALEAARDAWREAISAYQRTRAGAVGPADELRLMSSVAFDARPALIDDLLAGTDPLDAEALAGEGSAVRGLYAIEHALFAPGSDALASAAEPTRRCEYLVGAVALVREAVDEVAAAWTEGDARERFVAGLDGGPESTVAQVLNEVSRRLNTVDAMGLRDLAGAATAEELDEDRRDGPAAYGLAQHRAIIEGVTLVVGDGSSGLSVLIADADADLGQRVQDDRSAAATAMSALPDAVAEAFADPDAVDAASEAVADLKVLISTEVASQLGVTITFSDSDGDA
jgi:predicted lipoprotein